MSIPFRTESTIYKPSDIIKVLDMSVDKSMLVHTGRKEGGIIPVNMYQVAAAFDIETTSFYVDNIKQATMYEWTFGINGNVIIGRTWDEFLHMIGDIVEHLHLDVFNRLVVYVHNLGFEFQFMRKWFNWDKVFSIETRKPAYAITTDGIEFRCSFILSGYSLANLGDKLQKYPVKKMSGDLDYSLMRHSGTPLTDKELKYCENDVRVVMSYIQECMEIEGGIHKIPLTKTGYVRNYCRNSCLYTDSKNHKIGIKKYTSYTQLMKSLTLDVSEYRMLKQAFQGGFTHANARYSELVQEDVASFDFTSSYPYVMISNKFPMSKGEKIKIHSKDEFYSNLKRYCCLFAVRIYGLMTKFVHEHYLSFSKCEHLENATLDNGRIVCADYLETIITEQDFFIIQRTYSWDRLDIGTFIKYHKAYLPTDFVKSILKLYSDKTTLKGVEGKEIEYLAGKSMLNATFGMTVTDICRDEHIYTLDHLWDIKKPDFSESIEAYNKNRRRFLFYPWGVWITAYARRNLWTGILEFGSDYLYSDTDSLKVLNYQNHMNYINEYNKQCRTKLTMACDHHGIPFEMVEPSTIQGKKKLLGVWDFEGVYNRFKTLGAKRYMTEHNGKFSLTVSGVNPAIAIKFLLDKYGSDNVFNAFGDNLYIPAGCTGKNTHTYIDENMSGILVDYLGQALEYRELSGTHLEKADYSLSIAALYLDYIRGVRHIER